MKATTIWMKLLHRPAECRACVACDRPLPILSANDIIAAFVIETSVAELVAIVGECCLSRESRVELSRLRAEANAERCRR